MPICNQCRETVSKELGIVPMDSETSSDPSSLEPSGNSEGYKPPTPKSPQSQNAGEDSESLDLTTLSEGIDKIPQTRSVTRANPRSVIDQSVLDQVIGADPVQTVPYRPMKPARSALKANKEPKTRRTGKIRDRKGKHTEKKENLQRKRKKNPILWEHWSKRHLQLVQPTDKFLVTLSPPSDKPSHISRPNQSRPGKRFPPDSDPCKAALSPHDKNTHRKTGHPRISPTTTTNHQPYSAIHFFSPSTFRFQIHSMVTGGTCVGRGMSLILITAQNWIRIPLFSPADSSQHRNSEPGS